MRLRASSTRLHCSAAKTSHFGGLELAPLAGLEPFERQSRIDAAVQAADGVTDRLEHPADLSVSALVEGELHL